MRPDSKWVPSPNFRASTLARGISCVVIHATAESEIKGSLDWLCDPKSQVSSHYLIDTDGTILHLVHESNIAWHAGESLWDGRNNVNTFSIGIEVVNLNDGNSPYPDAQIQSLISLVVPICKDYSIKLENVVGHKDIAPGRKTDPAGFSMDDFRNKIKESGIA